MTELLQRFNKERKANKGKWIFFHDTLNDQPVAIKSYNTWIQVVKYQGRQAGGPMDCTVKAMTEFLTKFLDTPE